ncbi:MAG: ABC transporter ATP-binding protein [Paracoccaceae bacterium]|nr:ABC transporter ATP-binding protein [Paracoccaceae bacterium]
MSLLSVENLHINAQGKALVQGLSFAVEPGERLGLVGESGSGKSLTAMAILGLLPPAMRVSGSVLLAGKPVLGASEPDLARLRGAAAAVVFQEPLTALDPLMRLGKQVAESLARQARRAGRPLAALALRGAVLALLDQVALQDPVRVARAYPHEVSGGQRQRVALAMALACQPRLLIADEPTTALDVTTQAEILALLDSLVAARKMALLFISHDLAVVAQVADRVMVLQAGRMVEQGPVQQVFSDPRHAYTRTLVTAAQSFDRALGGRP